MTISGGSVNNHPQEAYVTMVTSDSYVVGALVLGHSLRRVGATRRLLCMITHNVAADSQAALREIFEVRVVGSLDSGDSRNLQLLGRPELGSTFTKIQLWTLTDLSKAVFLDADIMVLQNIDDLFDREEFSACADVGWPDCFNSGLFVCRPRMETFESLLKMALNQGSFDGGDQGLLNSYFQSWSVGPSDRRIPFVYNLTYNACYSYLPAFEKYRDQVRTVHFIGNNKPWNFARFSDGQVAARGDGSTVHLHYVQVWWSIHDEHVKPKASQSHPPSFMALYNGSGYNPYGHETSKSTLIHHPKMTIDGSNNDFANYRIKWTADVESFFQKKQLKKTPSRKLGDVGDVVDDEDERAFLEDDGGRRPAIRKPSPNAMTR